ncbi:MAG: CNNM domain-containing protein [Holosporaceae bacterium]|jgi:Mg2+/Co2+ transporter CorB|nr:CNNM domain-containing protein [Holosporaceae bacterium]
MVYALFILTIISLIALAGFISSTETAVMSVSRAYLYHIAKNGDERAKKVISLQKNMSTSLSTILVLNQFVLYLIPIVGTLFAVKYLSTAIGTILQTAIAFLSVIYAEIFPKMLAIRFTIPFALFVGPIVSKIVTLLKPVTAVLEMCARSTLKLIGVNAEAESTPEPLDEELRGAIEMHPSEGDKEESQKKSMLKGILDLENISVNHTMVHRKNLKTISISLPIDKMAEELAYCPFSRIPLWKNNPENIVGILKTKAFFSALQLANGNLEKIKINQLMSIPWFIPETTHLLDQLQNFKEKREHFALVVNEYGDLLGCITLEDILEEIVGEIVDEYDTLTSGIKVQTDGTVIVEGSTPVRDLNRQFDWNIPEEAATIGGYIMHEVRKIPDIGQIYILSGFKMEILKRQRNQINLVKIIPPLVAF